MFKESLGSRIAKEEFGMRRRLLLAENWLEYRTCEISVTKQMRKRPRNVKCLRKRFVRFHYVTRQVRNIAEHQT